MFAWCWSPVNLARLLPPVKCFPERTSFAKLFYAMHCCSVSVPDDKWAYTGNVIRFVETALIPVIRVLWSSCLLWGVFMSTSDKVLSRVDAQRCETGRYAHLMSDWSAHNLRNSAVLNIWGDPGLLWCGEVGVTSGCSDLFQSRCRRSPSAMI